MTDVSAFREYQAQTALIMERERVNEARKLALQELRQTVISLERDNQLRQERLDAEQAHFIQKQTAQDAKIAAKQRAAQSAQDELNALITREDELHSRIGTTENEINNTVNEITRRQEVQSLLAELQNDVESLRNVCDEKESTMMRLETQLARMEVNTEKRHKQINELLPEYSLPQMNYDKVRAMIEHVKNNRNNTNKGNTRNSSNDGDVDIISGLEDMTNESILLFDDNMTNSNQELSENSSNNVNDKNDQVNSKITNTETKTTTTAVSRAPREKAKSATAVKFANQYNMNNDDDNDSNDSEEQESSL